MSLSCLIIWKASCIFSFVDLSPLWCLFVCPLSMARDISGRYFSVADVDNPGQVGNWLFSNAFNRVVFLDLKDIGEGIWWGLPSMWWCGRYMLSLQLVVQPWIGWQILVYWGLVEVTRPIILYTVPWHPAILTSLYIWHHNSLWCMLQYIQHRTMTWLTQGMCVRGKVRCGLDGRSLWDQWDVEGCRVGWVELGSIW